MFEEMNRNIQTDVVRVILNTQIDRERIPRREKVAEPMVASHGKDSVKKPTVKKQRVGRNDPCPCGSGK